MWPSPLSVLPVFLQEFQKSDSRNLSNILFPSPFTKKKESNGACFQTSWSGPLFSHHHSSSCVVYCCSIPFRYDVMHLCWKGDPLDRPTFAALSEKLNKLGSSKESAVNFDLNPTSFYYKVVSGSRRNLISSALHQGRCGLASGITTTMAEDEEGTHVTGMIEGRGGMSVAHTN